MQFPCRLQLREGVGHAPHRTLQCGIGIQSCDLLLDPQSGFFSDVQLDDKGIQAVMDLRSKLGDSGQKLNDASKYVDNRDWQKAMQPGLGK